MDWCLEKLTHALESAVDGMSNEQLRWHPGGKWCAGEVLEHLYLTYTGTIKGFERVLESKKPLATEASLQQRWRTLVVLGLNYMPSGRQAPPTAQPKGLLLEDVRSGISAKIAAMDAIIARCEERYGSRIPLLDHTILGPLNAGQWRKFHLLHGLHHRNQLLRSRQFTSQRDNIVRG
jgi:DinB superfamily